MLARGRSLQDQVRKKKPKQKARGTITTAHHSQGAWVCTVALPLESVTCILCHPRETGLIIITPISEGFPRIKWHNEEKTINTMQSTFIRLPTNASPLWSVGSQGVKIDRREICQCIKKRGIWVVGTRGDNFSLSTSQMFCNEQELLLY